MVYSHYLSREESEKRIRALGPILAERLKDDIRFARPITWHNNPTLHELASAYALDPNNEFGLIDTAVEKACLAP